MGLRELPLAALAGLAACVVEGGLHREKAGYLGPLAGADSAAPTTDTDDEPVSDTGPDSAARACDDRSWGEEDVPQVAACARDPGLRADPLEATVLSVWNTSVVDDRMAPVAPVVGVVEERAVSALLTFDGLLFLVSARDGVDQWWVRGLNGDVATSAAIGDLDGDGVPDVVAAAQYRRKAIRGDGTELWAWEEVNPWSPLGAGAIADLDGDGRVEVVWGNRIYDGPTGELRGTGAEGIGSGCCDDGYRGIGVVADVDLDGVQEVVVGNALYDADGNTLWANGEEDGFVAVANFDDDDLAEIVVSGNTRLRLQDDDGTVLWDWEYFPPREDEYGWGGGPPAVADFDADGRPEIAVAGRDRVLVVDGSSGAIVWEAAKVSDNSGFGATGAFDIDGDGDADVLHGDMEYLYVFDGSTGAVLLQVPRDSGTGTELPVVADVDGDGHAEVLVDDTVWTSAGEPWAEARPTWNQHAFSLTNIEDDGTVPTYPEPNWLTYNSFRSAGLSVPGPFRGPDLYPVIADVCDDACGEGRVDLWLRVGNQGYGYVRAGLVRVEVWGTTGSGSAMLWSGTWAADLPAGRLSASLLVELYGIEGPLLDLWVELDGGDDRMAGRVEECDETNNVSHWGAWLCL